MTAENNPSSQTRGDMACYGMLAIALFAMGFSSGDPLVWFMVAPLMIANMAHPFLATTFTFSLSFIGHLLLALPFALLYKTVNLSGHTGYVSDYGFAFYLSLYLGTLALLKLYSEPDRKRIPRLIFCSSLMLTATGGELYAMAFGSLVALYALALVLALRTHLKIEEGARPHWPLRLILPGAVAATLLLTVGLAFFSHHYYFKVGRFFLRQVSHLPLEMTGGFSNQATLTSISEMKNPASGAEIALRAFTDRAPGYLRGAVFLNYVNHRWDRIPGERELRPLAILPDGSISGSLAKSGQRGRVQLPDRPPPLTGAAPDMEIIPVSIYGAHYFIPLETSAVNTDSRTLLLQGGGVLTSKYRSTSSGYEVFTDLEPRPQDEERDLYLTLPESLVLRRSLDKVIQELALPPEATARAKVQALSDYFNAKFTYRIGISFTPLVDPVITFLSPKIRHGHCELFATSGTLILRRLGLPARYVTGFLCEEKNPYGDLYLARNRDGHAWTEYYTPELGWQIAEFTPSDGIPQADSETGFNSFLEYLRGSFARLYQIGLTGIVNLLLSALALAGQWILGRWYRILLFVLLLGGFFLFRFFRHGRRRSATRHHIRHFPADLASLRQKAARLEKKLAALGLGRKTGETLDEYALRLEAETFPDQADALALLHTLAERRYRPF